MEANTLFLAFIYANTHKNYNIACTDFSWQVMLVARSPKTQIIVTVYFYQTNISHSFLWISARKAPRLMSKCANVCLQKLLCENYSLELALCQLLLSVPRLGCHSSHSFTPDCILRTAAPLTYDFHTPSETIATANLKLSHYFQLLRIVAIFDQESRTISRSFALRWSL